MDSDDLNRYNGDAEHDMCVDLYNYKNTSEPPVYTDVDIDRYIDNLNDWD